MSKIDRLWLYLDEFSLYSAAWLFTDRNPPEDPKEANRLPPRQREVADLISKRTRVVHCNYWTPDGPNITNRTKVSRHELCKVAEEIGFRPYFLFRESDELKDSERTTLLKMVLGMAMDKYGFDPDRKRNKATGEGDESIAVAIQRKGLSIDNGSILKYLTEAHKFLE